MLRSSVSLFIFFQFFTISVLAASPQRAFSEQFQTSRLWFPAEDDPILNNASGRYPVFLNFLFQNVLSWIPSGAPKVMSPNCEPEVWGARLQDPRVKDAISLQGALVQKYFQDCAGDLATGNTSSFVNLSKMMTMKFQPQVHPFMRRVVVQLPGNVKLKGLLGLKGDFKARPFVIMRLGIFSSIEDFKPERAWAMMMFEQSPFNVLLLENMSSGDFVADNSQFAFGGYDEGLQNILVAKLLQDPMQPISRLVDSVHIFGVSLGGHGTLFASLLNDFNSPKNRPLIQSFSAMCPVVNLQDTMQNLTSGGAFSAMVDLWSRERLKGLGSKMSAVNDYDNFSFLKKAVSEIARTYQGGLSYVSGIHLPPGMKDGADFWGLNDFWKFYNNVKQPVLIVATDQDMAVPYALNSARLQNKSMKVDSKNIRVVNLPEGYHCTLAIPYDWKALSTVLQSYVLSHSPNFKMEQKSLVVDLGDEDWKEFYSAPATLQLKVEEPDKDHNFVKLEIEVVNSAGKEKTLNLSLPLSDFDFRFFNKELTDPETEMLTRWLNQNLKVELLNEKIPKIKISWKVAA
jgi:pimeloyl-ACP methyl ester carboxylesterase